MTKDNSEPSEDQDKPDAEAPSSDKNTKDNEEHLDQKGEIEALFHDLMSAIDKFGETVLGKDMYGTNERTEEWESLSTADRHILRAAFIFTVMSYGVMDDFKENPHYVAIAIGPGPLGTVITLGLCVSYLMRQDERSKNLRKEIKEMLDKGVSLDQFEDVLRPKQYSHNALEVDKAELVKKCLALMADQTIELNKDFIEKAGRTYQRMKDDIHFKTYVGAHVELDDYIGEENTDRILSVIFNTASFAEKGTIKAYEKTIPPLWEVTKKAGKSVLSEAWESTKTSISMMQDLGKQLNEGIEFNKEELRRFFKRFKPK